MYSRSSVVPRRSRVVHLRTKASPSTCSATINPIVVLPAPLAPPKKKECGPEPRTNPTSDAPPSSASREAPVTSGHTAGPGSARPKVSRSDPRRLVPCLRHVSTGSIESSPRVARRPGRLMSANGAHSRVAPSVSTQLTTRVVAQCSSALRRFVFWQRRRPSVRRKVPWSR